MPDTFHGFPKLPPELRNAIWNQAIRPQLPGAQVFRYYTGPEDDDYANVAVKPLDPKSQHLAAPEFSESDGPDVYDEENISWYLYDAGMWSACKESWRVMSRHYARDPGSETGYFANPNGTADFFTFHPCKDLCVLQVHNWMKFRPYKSDDEWWHQDVPFGMELALEYGPELDLESAYEATGRSYRAFQHKEIFIIDYDCWISKESAESAMRWGGRCFYARDRRLVEVIYQRSLDCENIWSELDEMNFQIAFDFAPEKSDELDWVGGDERYFVLLVCAEL